MKVAKSALIRLSYLYSLLTSRLVISFNLKLHREYDKRVALYNESVWTCQCTGATKLTHREALESEQKALKLLNGSFPVIFEKPVLELVHLS